MKDICYKVTILVEAPAHIPASSIRKYIAEILDETDAMLEVGDTIDASSEIFFDRITVEPT